VRLIRKRLCKFACNLHVGRRLAAAAAICIWASRSLGPAGSATLDTSVHDCRWLRQVNSEGYDGVRLSERRISLQVLLGLPLGLASSSSHSIHFFTESLSYFCSTCTCLYHRSLFFCSTETMSYKPSFSLNPFFGTLSCSLAPHIHLTILISTL